MRDIFDVIALRQMVGLDLEGSVLAHLPEDRLARLVSRLEMIVPFYGVKVFEQVNPTPMGEIFMAQEGAEQILDVVQRYQRRQMDHNGCGP